MRAANDLDGVALYLQKDVLLVLRSVLSTCPALPLPRSGSAESRTSHGAGQAKKQTCPTLGRRLAKFQMQCPSDRGSRPLHRFQLHLDVVGIEQAVELGPTRLHAPRHGAFGKTLSPSPAALPREHLLDRPSNVTSSSVGLVAARG